MPVHNIDMDIFRARRVDRAHFLAELRKVGGQDRRGNADRLLRHDDRNNNFKKIKEIGRNSGDESRLTYG